MEQARFPEESVALQFGTRAGSSIALAFPSPALSLRAAHALKATAKITATASGISL